MKAGGRAKSGCHLRLDRADLTIPLVFVLVDVNDRLLRSHVEAQERLRHRIDLVVVGAVWKGRSLFDEVVYPRCLEGMRKIDIAGLDQRADRGGARLLTPFRIHRQDAGDFVLQHLNDSRPVGSETRPRALPRSTASANTGWL